jgi:pimeloyl-ACP methyl ester carboxylesterase
MSRRGRTPPFRRADGAILPGSVADIGYLRLGGSDQWVMVRGESVANPLLILLHGGPGFPEMRLFRHFNAALESRFTVVYWEQRGTDKSFDTGIPLSSMTVERFLGDLDELVDAMCRRFGTHRVALYGHSWGSALGVLYSARFPEKVAAYVGTGQVGDWPASERASYAFTLAEAARRDNRRALEELRAVGPPPHTGRQVRIQRRWLARFVGIVRGTSLGALLRITLGGPESSIRDLPNVVRGLLFSECMWPEVSALNLVKAVPVLQVPLFLFIGRHDHVIDAATSAAYFDAVAAPSKTLLWFEESAHEPPFEEPDQFNRAMVELVRPAVAPG